MVAITNLLPNNLLGIPRYIHRTVYSDQVTIIGYHGIIRDHNTAVHDCFVHDASFRFQIKYLVQHFKIMSLSEALYRLEKGDIRSPTAVITFDDGFQNNFDVAFPILCDAGVPATIFLTTKFIDTTDTIWFCRLLKSLSATKLESFRWKKYTYDLRTDYGRANAQRHMQIKLKNLPHKSLLREIQKMVLALGDDPNAPISIQSPFRMLNRESIARMRSSGLIDFGAHTHSHAILSRLETEEAHEEIQQSVRSVKELTGDCCNYFAYPNGLKQDYNTENIRKLHDCGVYGGVTARPGPNNSQTPQMELRRYNIGRETSMARFQLLVHHCLEYGRSIIKSKE